MVLHSLITSMSVFYCNLHWDGIFTTLMISELRKITAVNNFTTYPVVFLAIDTLG